MGQARKQIDYKALAEVLAEAPGGGLDMDAIARRLGLAKPTLYRLAGSRERLIELSVDAETERLLEAIHRSGVSGIFEFTEETPAGAKLLFASGFTAARVAVQRVERRLAETLRRASAPEGAATSGNLTSPAAGVLGMAVAIACHAVASDTAPQAERMRSAFDRAANLAREISDTVGVHAATRAT